MKLRKRIPLAVGLSLLGMISAPVFAATDSADAQQSEQQMLDTFNKRTEQLTEQVAELQAELRKVEANQQNSIKRTSKPKVVVHHVVSTQPPIQANAVPPTPINTVPPPLTQAVGMPKKPRAGNAPAISLVPVEPLVDKPAYVGGFPVTTSPYIGIQSEFNASDLIINLPFLNEDLNLLTQRKKMEQVYESLGLPYPEHPFLEVSGIIQAYGYESRPWTGPKVSDIDLNLAEIDFAAMINPWTTGLLALRYDNTPPDSGPRVANSRVFINRGYVTLGNLEKFPIYGSIGQYYVPFGQYNTNMITDPTTKLLARTLERAVTLGYDAAFCEHQSFNLSLYTFKGDASTDRGGANQLNQWGTNADYNITRDGWNGNIGAGYIYDIADSVGLQGTNISPGDLKSFIPTGFPGFGGPGLETLINPVDAYDIHGNLGVGNWGLTAEWISAMRSFNVANLSFDGHGSRPTAFNTELNYNFNMWDRPSGIAVGYGTSSDALAILLPYRRVSATLNTSIWRDTIESLEWRHDINYSSSSTASGQGIPVQQSGVGHSSDCLTAQIAAFF